MTQRDWLMERAESYGKDAARLRSITEDLGGLTGHAWAIVYDTVRDELRKCAAEFERSRR